MQNLIWQENQGAIGINTHHPDAGSEIWRTVRHESPMLLRVAPQNAFVRYPVDIERFPPRIPIARKLPARPCPKSSVWGGPQFSDLSNVGNLAESVTIEKIHAVHGSMFGEDMSGIQSYA